MAVGGSHIHNKGNGSNGGGTRGRSYGLMLMLAFGAALLGVMILHKLRERRIYNLLVKERDNELISLHLLLQVPSFFFSSLLHADYDYLSPSCNATHGFISNMHIILFKALSNLQRCFYQKHRLQNGSNEKTTMKPLCACPEKLQL